MGQGIIILLLFALLIPLWMKLKRDYVGGIAYGVFLCVSMSTVLRLPMPGSLPQLTIFRLVLISFFVFWLFNRQPDQKLTQAPLFKTFCFWSAANFVSLLMTTAGFVTSLKSYLDFVVEAAVFFCLLATSLKNREDAFRVLKAACIGVALVACFAFVEKYTRFNPVHFLVGRGGKIEGQVSLVQGITAMYQHRILLGTGMAMGWPLVLALMLAPTESKPRKALLWGAIALLAAACYFSNSRGPWLASILAAGTLFVLGGSEVRRKLRILGLLAVVVLILKPGVWTSFVMGAKVTTQTDSFKGGTFQYRLELWRVAWTTISQSPERWLFGQGPAAGMDSKVSWSLSYRGGQAHEIWSWDNHLAYDLFQSGVIGFMASVLLYGGVLLGVYRGWRNSSPEDKPFMACLVASLVAYSFMLTNVLMFTKPVNFLFWTIGALGYTFAWRTAPAPAFEEETDPELLEVDGERAGERPPQYFPAVS